MVEKPGVGGSGITSEDIAVTVQSPEQRKRQGTDAAPSPRGTPGRSTSASRTPRGSPRVTPGGTRASWEGDRCRVVHATLAAFTAVKRC